MNWNRLFFTLAVTGLAVFGQDKSKPHTESAWNDSTSNGSPTGVDDLLGALWGNGNDSLHTNRPGMRPPCQDCVFPVDDDQRSSKSIVSTIKRHSPDLKKIFHKYLKPHPGFKGKIIFHFAIAPDGGIIELKIISSTTGNENFDKEILEKIKQWRFEPIKGKSNDIVTVPFDFSE